MRKILLVYEDFNELTTLEASLKKGGFDVIGLSTEYSLNEKMLSFNPDIVIASGRGPKVSTISVGKKLKEMSRWPGKSILIFPSGFKPNPQDLIKARMDLILESPIPLNRMIQILAKFTGLSEQTLLDKINKISVSESELTRVSNSNYTAETEAPVFVKGLKRDKEEAHHTGIEFEVEESQVIDASLEQNTDEKNVLKSNQKESSKDEKNLRSDKSNEEENRLKGTTSEGSGGFALKNQSSEKSKDPFEQMKNELSSEKPEFKFDLDNPFKENEDKKENKKFEGLNLKSDQPNGPSELTLDKATEVKGRFEIVDELAAARKNSAARQARYQEQLKGAPALPAQSTLRDRKAIRKAFKEMSKDWNKDDLKEQDRLRREFATAMFKKTR